MDHDSEGVCLVEDVEEAGVELTDDLWRSVLSTLVLADICRAAQVCKTLRRLTSEETFWQLQCQRRLDADCANLQLARAAAADVSRGLGATSFLHLFRGLHSLGGCPVGLWQLSDPADGRHPGLELLSIGVEAAAPSQGGAAAVGASPPSGSGSTAGGEETAADGGGGGAPGRLMARGLCYEPTVCPDRGWPLFALEPLPLPLPPPLPLAAETQEGAGLGRAPLSSPLSSSTSVGRGGVVVVVQTPHLLHHMPELLLRSRLLSMMDARKQEPAVSLRAAFSADGLLMTLDADDTDWQAQCAPSSDLAYAAQWLSPNADQPRLTYRRVAGFALDGRVRGHCPRQHLSVLRGGAADVLLGAPTLLAAPAAVPGVAAAAAAAGAAAAPPAHEPAPEPGVPPVLFPAVALASDIVAGAALLPEGAPEEQEAGAGSDEAAVPAVPPPAPAPPPPLRRPAYLQALSCLEGLWTAVYGGHGRELVQVRLADDGVAPLAGLPQGPRLDGLKLVGDPNVPSGQFTFHVDLAGILRGRYSGLNFDSQELDPRMVLSYVFGGQNILVDLTTRPVAARMRGLGQINERSGTWAPQYRKLELILYYCSDHSLNQDLFSILWLDEDRLYRDIFDFTPYVLPAVPGWLATP